MNSHKIQVDNHEAVILHTHDYRNSSLIVHFFVKQLGKISAVAKGVKRSKQHRFSLLQPFQKVSVSLIGKQDLLTLTQIEAIEPSWELTGKALYCAYYLNELLLRLLPAHTDCQAIFNLYVHIMNVLLRESLSSNDHKTVQSLEAPLRIFELKLLEFLGYGLNVTQDTLSGEPVREDKNYYYLMASGPSLAAPDSSGTMMISGRTLIAMAQGRFNELKTLHESKQLLKWALSEHLGDKPLKSRELFKQLYGS